MSVERSFVYQSLPLMVEERIFWRRKGQGSRVGRGSVAVATGQRRTSGHECCVRGCLGGNGIPVFLLLFRVKSWADVYREVGEGEEEMTACNWSIQKHLDIQK